MSHPAHHHTPGELQRLTKNEHMLFGIASLTNNIVRKLPAAVLRHAAWLLCTRPAPAATGSSVFCHCCLITWLLTMCCCCCYFPTCRTNSLPTATPDTYTYLPRPSPCSTAFICNDPTAVTPVNGVLKNDVDPEGQPLTATLLTSTTNGALTFNGNGFVYTPNPGFTGVLSRGTVSSNNRCITTPRLKRSATVTEAGPRGGKLSTQIPPRAGPCLCPGMHTQQHRRKQASLLPV